MLLFWLAVQYATGNPLLRIPLSLPDARRRLSSDIPLRNYENLQFFGMVGVGSPPQQIPVLFDTGSSDFWVRDSRCSGCAGTTRYDRTVSTTHVPLNTSFQLEYGSGTVSGLVARDTIHLGSYHIKHAVIGQAQAEHSLMLRFKASGICGLGFDALAQIQLRNQNHDRRQTSTLLQSLFRQYPQMPSVFSFYLASHARGNGTRQRSNGNIENEAITSKQSAGSQLILGGSDITLAGPHASWLHVPLVRYPVDAPDFAHWAVRLRSFRVMADGNMESSSKRAKVRGVACFVYPHL
jgi:hypothetical protein